MNRIVTLVAIVSTLALPSIASAGTYQDAMRACGAEWRASEARTHVKKGEGAAAWNAFRKECTARVGWERKPKAPASSPAIAPKPADQGA